MRVENVFSLIFVSIGNAVSPYVSQNLGAKKIERIKKGYHAALVLDVCFAVLAFIVIETSAYPDFLVIPGERRNCPGISGVRGLYEMAWLLFHLHGHQDGNGWRSSRTWNHAAVSYCKYGKPCNPLVCCFDLCTAFWHCICLACCTSWLVCELFNILCGSSEIMAD